MESERENERVKREISKEGNRKDTKGRNNEREL
jgi:hypothetical protein